MARTVDEIMNGELLAVRPETSAREARELLRTFRVGALPVLDDAQRPIGVLSLRDLFDVDGTAGERMTKPAMCVAASALIEQAARQLARTDRHHLVVVDGSGKGVGMLSTLDLLRAVLGMPTPHPSTFPHWDEINQVSWTNDWSFDEPSCASAPDLPGFLLVVCGVLGERDTVVWTEPCASVRARSLELVSLPSEWPPSLLQYVDRPGLRFRAATGVDESSRQRIAALFRDRLEHVPPRGLT